MTAPTDNTVIAVTKSEFTWVKHHLILLVFVIILALGGIYFLDSLSAKHAAESDARWQKILYAQQQQADAAEKRAEAAEAHTAQVQAQQQILIGQFTSAISQRNTAVEKQKQIDATLSAADASVRLSQQTNAKEGEVVAQGDSVLIDLPVARTVVANLDLLPVVQANLVDTQKQFEAETKIADSALSTLVDEQNLRVELNKTLLTKEKSCTATINKLKSDARKSKLKLGFITYVSGVVSGLLLHLGI